ncbi:MAG: family 20 glycosylhydrolase, partial [Rhodothermales bacterium]|nr:family 20 glycosylhydrolase [Rhodothermales bacterium]
RLSEGVIVAAPSGLRNEADLLVARLSEFAGVTAVVEEQTEDQQATIRLKVEESTDAALTGRVAEGYSLTVDPASGIDVIGKSPAGVFYGTQSLLALIDPHYLGAGEAVVPAMRVVDTPRFGYRGMHLDVSRNFQPEEAVLKLLDLMSFYKLNRFHFHLTDDEGWRLAIDGLPELTEVGAFRGHTTTERDHLAPSFGSGPNPDPAVSRGSGFYDRDAFIRILRYATARHIEVIPEIDVPGHARAAIVSMKSRHDRLVEEGDEAGATQYLLRHPDDASTYRSVQGWNDNVIDVCIPSTYEFLRHVIAEVVEMYGEAGAPLTTIHTGGDEVPGGVWQRSPACEELRSAEGDVHLPSLFLDRISDIISEHGLVTAGWEEVALHMEHWQDHAGKVPDPARRDKGILPYVWNSIWGAGSEELAYRLANFGFDVVLSSASNLYFDLAYDKHPEEPGYYWAGYVDMRKPFELEPLDLYRSGKEDLLGNPIDPAAYASSEPLSSAGQSRILGIQGQLWGENAKSFELMEYLAFPRVIVLSEIAWASKPEWSREQTIEGRDAGLAESWNEFANRLGQRELLRLNHAFGRVSFRIPPPGAVIEDGVLKANVALPGLVIRYATDGAIPDLESTLYEGPVDVTSPVNLMTFDALGRGSRVVRVNVRQ